MADKKTNYDEIQDEYLDSLIRLAYKNAEALEAQRLMEEDDTPPSRCLPMTKMLFFRCFLRKWSGRRRENSLRRASSRGRRTFRGW